MEDGNSDGRFRRTLELLLDSTRLMVDSYEWMELREQIYKWYNALEKEPTVSDWSYILQSLAFIIWTSQQQEIATHWVKNAMKFMSSSR